jgi:alcohol dehydrogenase (cytochrome c)
MMRGRLRAIRRALSLAILGSSGIVTGQEITEQHLLDGLKNPGRWLMYSGDYMSQRHSPLTQITPANVDQLKVQWTFQTGVLGKFEATPIVVDGIMYVTGANNNAWALDARTGRRFWRYERSVADRIPICCGRVNRGFAAYKNRLYMTTLDAHLVAMDPKTGRIIWDVEIDQYKRGYSGTVAPLVVKDKIVVGIAGAEYGVRGFLDAFDAETGKRAWRFWTVPAAGEPGGDTWSGDSWERGGGSTWVTGSYDPELDLIYWGTGNPGPDLYGGDRKGDNLYTDSVVALDASTGKLRWHYQFTPHDVHDWDAVQVPVLADMPVGGMKRKLMLWANRNGFMYTLDRTNGKLVAAKPFVNTTWAKEIGPDGRPILLPSNDIAKDGTVTCPGVGGGTNWMSPAFNPALGLFFVTAREYCDKFYAWPQGFAEGQYYFGGAYQRDKARGSGSLKAIDPLTATVKWEFKYPASSSAGVLSTASGLVFAGDSDGNLMALNARTGKNLWYFQTGGNISAAPMTFQLDGKQYLVLAAGNTLFSFALPGNGAF